jgi:hypothetical protein
MAQNGLFAIRPAMSASDAVDGSPPPAAIIAGLELRRATMGNVATIGLDIAKSVFQVHGVEPSIVHATRGHIVAIHRNGRPDLGGSFCFSCVIPVLALGVRMGFSVGHEVLLGEQCLLATQSRP